MKLECGRCQSWVVKRVPYMIDWMEGRCPQGRIEPWEVYKVQWSVGGWPRVDIRQSRSPPNFLIHH